MTKSDRFIHILALLLRQGKATAPQLAQELGVSRRTIGRDVDALCQAGFPVMTAQGRAISRLCSRQNTTFCPSS